MNTKLYTDFINIAAALIEPGAVFQQHGILERFEYISFAVS